MSSDEREIFNYLQTWGTDFVSANEVCRRATTKKRYHDDQDWAKPLLQVMLERGVLERDLQGRYRIKPQKKKKHDGRWVSPDIAAILEENGVETDPVDAEASPEEGPAED